MPIGEFSIEVERAGLEAARKQLDPAQYDRKLRGAMEESLAFLKGLVQANTPVDRNFLRGGVFTELRGTSVDLHGIVAPSAATKEYAIVQELGRRPGGRMPPVEAITAWVKRKGIAGTYNPTTRRRRGSRATQRTQDETVGFLIARKIAREGTKGYHMFETAARTGKPVVLGIFGRWLRG